MSTHWDKIKSMAFEDRIAQMALAVLYSSTHIDVTLKALPFDETEVKRRATETIKTKKFGKWRSQYGPKPQSADAVALTTAEEGAVTKLVKEARDKEDLKSFDAVINAWLEETGEARANAPYTSPDIGIIFRQYQGTIAPSSQVSEVNFDTVAATIIGDTLYLACNYKVRRMPSELNLSMFSYSGFDQMSPNSRGLIVSALKQDLNDKSILGDEFADRAKALKFVVFVGLATEPKNDKESAAPHAEMQLLSFIVSQDLSVFGQYVGVNKPCCGGCYDTLRSVKMKCAEPRGKDFTNWLEPGKIETKVMDKRGF